MPRPINLRAAENRATVARLRADIAPKAAAGQCAAQAELFYLGEAGEAQAVPVKVRAYDDRGRYKGDVLPPDAPAPAPAFRVSCWRVWNNPVALAEAAMLLRRPAPSTKSAPVHGYGVGEAKCPDALPDLLIWPWRQALALYGTAGQAAVKVREHLDTLAGDLDPEVRKRAEKLLSNLDLRAAQERAQERAEALPASLKELARGYTQAAQAAVRRYQTQRQREALREKAAAVLADLDRAIIAAVGEGTVPGTAEEIRTLLLS